MSPYGQSQIRLAPPQGVIAMTDQLTAAHDRITDAVEQLVTGADWQTMLDIAARFHTYSPNNIWLILAQRPDAT